MNKETKFQKPCGSQGDTKISHSWIHTLKDRVFNTMIVILMYECAYCVHCEQEGVEASREWWLPRDGSYRQL